MNDVTTKTPNVEQQALGARSYTLSVRLTNTCPEGKPSPECCGNAEWMRVIWRVNALRPGSFGEPIWMHDWKTDMWAEEYPRYRVIIGGAATNYIQAFNAESAEILRLAVLQVTGMMVDNHGQCQVRIEPTHPNG